MRDEIVYGTYPLAGEKLHSAIRQAIRAGYQSFDTAQLYGNERDLGAAFQRLGIKREDFKVTTKIAPFNYSAAGFLLSLRRSLAELKLDQVDLLLLHFPPDASAMPEILEMLASAQHGRLARSVGVSNFPPALMRKARDLSAIPLTVNQVEFHPLVDVQALLSASREAGIPLQAYSPLARGAVFGQPMLHELAQKYRVTLAQIVFRWILQHGVTLVTQSANPDNISANINVPAIILSDEDMRKIDALGELDHRIITKRVIPWAPDWD